jgi:hypothetical protein
MNHPTTVKRAYDAPTRRRRRRPEQAKRLEHEIERLTFEVEAWRKKA